MKLFKSLKKLGKRSSRRKIAASKKLESKRAAAGKDAIKTNDEPISSPTPVRRDEKRTTKSSVQRTDAPPATPTSNNEPKPVGNPNQEAARRLSSASSVSDVEEVVKKDHSMRNMAVAAMAPLAGAAVAIGAVINHNQEDESIGHGLIGPMGGLNMDTSVVPFTTNDYGSDDNGHAAAAILGVVGVAAAAGTIKAAKSYMGSASDNVSDRKAAMLASNSTASSSLSFSSSEPSGPLTTSPSDNSKPTPADALVAADAVDAFNAGSARSSTTSTSGNSKPVPADALVAADAVDAFNADSARSSTTSTSDVSTMREGATTKTAPKSHDEAAAIITGFVASKTANKRHNETGIQQREQPDAKSNVAVVNNSPDRFDNANGERQFVKGVDTTNGATSVIIPHSPNKTGMVVGSGEGPADNVSTLTM